MNKYLGRSNFPVQRPPSEGDCHSSVSTHCTQESNSGLSLYDMNRFSTVIAYTTENSVKDCDENSQPSNTSSVQNIQCPCCMNSIKESAICRRMSVCGCVIHLDCSDSYFTKQTKCPGLNCLVDYSKFRESCNTVIPKPLSLHTNSLLAPYMHSPISCGSSQTLNSSAFIDQLAPTPPLHRYSPSPPLIFGSSPPPPGLSASRTNRTNDGHTNRQMLYENLVNCIGSLLHHEAQVSGQSQPMINLTAILSASNQIGLKVMEAVAEAMRKQRKSVQRQNAHTLPKNMDCSKVSLSSSISSDYGPRFTPNIDPCFTPNSSTEHFPRGVMEHSNRNFLTSISHKVTTKCNKQEPNKKVTVLSLNGLIDGHDVNTPTVVNDKHLSSNESEEDIQSLVSALNLSGVDSPSGMQTMHRNTPADTLTPMSKSTSSNDSTPSFGHENSR